VLNATFNVPAPVLSMSGDPSFPATVSSMGPVQVTLTSASDPQTAMATSDGLELANAGGTVFLNINPNSLRISSLSKNGMMMMTGRYAVSGDGAYAPAGGAGTLTIVASASGERITIHTTKAS
jgi:hypothetical protein